jgi:hypothetical protein
MEEMKQPVTKAIKTEWRNPIRHIRVIHPFLFALYPVLAAYARNIAQVSLSEVVRPAIVLLGVTSVIFFLLYVVYRKDVDRAGFVTALILFITMYYSYQYRLPQYIPVWGFPTNRNVIILTFWAVFLVIVTSTWVWKRVRPATITRFLNLLACLSMIFPLRIIFMQWIIPSPIARWQPNLPPIQASAPPASTPDIYYIILDGYLRADVLQEIYGFDNSNFIQGLQERGFYVAEGAYSNYYTTSLSLPSSLNADYLEFPNEFITDQSLNFSPLRQLFLQNRVMDFLKSQGYKIVALSSGYFITEYEQADVYLKPYLSPLSNFETLLLQTSIAWVPFEFLPPDIEFILPGYGAHRRNILYGFEQLVSLSEIPGPKFVFAHIAAPHPPFVFGANGENITPDRPFTLLDGSYYIGSNEEYLKAYQAQLQYINILTLQAIDGIRESEKQLPIIIIQADHGSGLYLDWDTADKSCVRERLSILNAYFVSGPGKERLYSSISPVNTFRLILSTYLGANLDLLPDRAYFASQGIRLYDLIDVTSRTTDRCRIP